MQTAAYSYYNGRICPSEEMMIPARDRAYYFGDGIYDVASVYGGRCFAIDDHLDRFMGNAEKLRLNPDFSREELKKLCIDFINEYGPASGHGVLYMQLSRGTAPRNHAFPENAKANLFMEIKKASFPLPGRKVKAITLEDKRFQMCDIKTVNLLLNCIAQQSAVEQGCYEAILHRGDRVTEGSHSGVSILSDGQFITPPLDEFILPSVTRKHWIELCTRVGIPVRERIFTLEELMSADEVVIMSTTAVCNVCTEINGIPVGGRDAKNLAAVCDAYLDMISSQTGIEKGLLYADS